MSYLPRFAPTLALLGFLLGACGGPTGAGELDPAVILARDRAADYAARGGGANWSKAVAALAPLLARKDVPLEDLLRAANANLADVETPGDPAERARPYLERAEALAPDDPVVLWCRYHAATMQGDSQTALTILRRLVGLRPDDFTVQLALAQTLDGIDEPGTEAESQALYEKLLEIPPEYTGAWRVPMLYRRMLQLFREGREEEAQPLKDELEALADRGIQTPKDAFHSPGTLGVVPPHTPELFERAAPKPLRITLERRGLAASGVSGAFRADLGWSDATRAFEPSDDETFATHSTSAIVAFGPSGVMLAQVDGSAHSLLDVPVVDAAPFDRRNHGVDKASDSVASRKTGDRELDLLLVVEQAEGSGLLLLDHEGEAWKPEPLVSLPRVAGPGSLLPVDYDHDGDVDLFVSTTQGPRLLRNDGLDGTGSFTDASDEVRLPAGDYRVQSEDFDRDNDVDFLFVPRAGGAPRLLSNERVSGVGRFQDKSSTLPAGLAGRWIVAADFDGDSWVDLAVFGSDLALYTRTELGGWRTEVKHLPLAHAPTGEPVAVDWDLDGAFDLLWPCAEAPAAALLAPAFAAGGLAELVGEPFSAPVVGSSSLEVADLDGDLDLDLLRVDPTGTAVFLAQGAPTGMWLAFQGHKDNARGLGAVVELRSGLLYQRLYYRGRPELVGFGGKPIDMVRVTWPNGVVQGNFDLAAGSRTIVAQRLGQIGSCPFLYTWNGTTYEFVSDVLGVTPLGLPMGPGMLVPPDHDEYVLVRGEQLVPRDGVYEMHFTEELREVTYLDRVRLDVVDHPADIEIFPNERFSFPPFPEAHTHTVKDALSPLSAVDQDGKDWTKELAANDRTFAIPFEALNGPYRGLATPYTLELAFDPARVKDAAKLRLFLNGWFYWTDASVNMAAARSPDVEFVPPLLSVPDGEGGWKDCGSIDFPAGKLKTMVFDVSALLNRDDPRLRLFSTLRLYWDSIRLATDADDAPLVTTPIEPSSARLWQRGFSRSYPLLGAHDCEWFTWDELELEPRWNQHPGLYTRLGETAPLLHAIDDEFVILGAGDALTLRFDATQAPPLPDGWRRDYLVFLDGEAKDRDPNTVEALHVEPLPFHGMSGYPYGTDGDASGEHYPDDEEHRAYQREWNTRQATRWIEPVVPQVLPGRARAMN